MRSAQGCASWPRTWTSTPCIALDEGVRKLKNDSQAIQADQNRLSKEIAKAPSPEARAEIKAKGAALKERNEQLLKDLAAQEAALDEKLLELPNLPHPSVPVGKDESENRIVREEGAKRAFAFTPRPTGIWVRAGASSTSTAGSRSRAAASTCSRIGAPACNAR